VGAGLPANIGTAGAIHRGAGFAGKPAPTKNAGEPNGSFGSIAAIRVRQLSTRFEDDAVKLTVHNPDTPLPAGFIFDLFEPLIRGSHYDAGL